MSDSQETRFSELVAKKLMGKGEGARTLWLPLAQEFDRGGSDDVKQYLDAQKQQLEGQIENSFSQI